MSDLVHPTFHPMKVLVPIDFSLSSLAALHVASEMARSFRAELYLLHVIPMLPMVAEAGSALFYPEREFAADAEKEAERLIRGVKASKRIEIGNDVVGNVLMVLEREHADMLIISTHGMSGWRATVFGSIAEKVIRLAECPLLLLRSARA